MFSLQSSSSEIHDKKEIVYPSKNMSVLDQTTVVVSFTMSLIGHAGVVSSNRNET